MTTLLPLRYPMSMLTERRLSTSVGVGGSALLHIGVAVLLLLFHRAALPDVPRLRSIAVEVLSEAQYRAATQAPQLSAPTGEVTAPAPPPVAQTPPRPAPAPVPSETVAPPGMVRATHLFAADLLAEPASKEVRETLPLLANDERVAQMCNIEGLEQLRQWDASLSPDTLVPYAMADMDVRKTTLTADGAAFRSKRKWYGVKFVCEVAADFQSVTAFEFSVGAAIPEVEWASHDLTAEDFDDD